MDSILLVAVLQHTYSVWKMSRIPSTLSHRGSPRRALQARSFAPSTPLHRGSPEEERACAIEKASTPSHRRSPLYPLALLLLLVSAGVAASPPPITFLPAVSSDSSKVQLGKRLFFDQRLSRNGRWSCADCHRPEQGYALNRPRSPGGVAGGGFRNVPSLMNTVHQQQWGREGRHRQLPAMVAEMFESPFTLALDPLLLEQRMAQDPDYVRMFSEAGYPQISAANAYAAVAEYLRILTSRNAPLDTGTLSAAARRGKALFEGRAGCLHCHSGALLSDGQAHSLGLLARPGHLSELADREALLAYALAHDLEEVATLQQDPGHFTVTGRRDDWGAFITPSLRELNHSGPYMHDGRFYSISQVVEFYYFGGGPDSRKSPLLRPLDLTLEELNDLIAFLESLSGQPLTSERYLWSQGYPAAYPTTRYWSSHPAGEEQ